MFTKKSRKCTASLPPLCDHHDVRRGEARIINSLAMHIVLPTDTAFHGIIYHGIASVDELLEHKSHHIARKILHRPWLIQTHSSRRGRRRRRPQRWGRGQGGRIPQRPLRG